MPAARVTGVPFSSRSVRARDLDLEQLPSPVPVNAARAASVSSAVLAGRHDCRNTAPTGGNDRRQRIQELHLIAAVRPTAIELAVRQRS